MKLFNVCRTHGQTFLRGTKNAIEIPKGAFYGKDAEGLYYILDTRPYRSEGGTIYLELYRFKNSRWQVGMESGKTVDTIHRIAYKNGYYGMKQEKCLHMYGVVQSRNKTVGSRHYKMSVLKDSSRSRAERGSYSNIY